MTGSTKYIFLHVACTVRRPATWRFHAKGVWREIERFKPHVRDTLMAIASLF